MATRGALKSTRIVTTDDLRENGGRWKLQEGPAIKVRGYTTSNIGSRMIKGGDAQPVYVLSDTDIRSGGGRWRVNAGQAIQVTDVIGDARGVIQGSAIPVFPVDDSGVYDPNFAGFLPTQIADLELWLAADRGLSLSDGDPVVTWLDQSGNGKNATQGVGANQPTFRTGIVNSLPIIRFDGVTEYLTFLSLTLPSFTIFYVLSTTIVPAGVVVILDNCTGNPNANDGFWMGWDDRGAANPNDSYVMTPKFVTAPLGWFKDNSYGLAAFTTLVFQCSNHTDIYYSINNVDQAPYGVLGAGTGAYVDNANVFGLGALNDGTAPAGMDLAELIIYGSVLSSADRDLVENYLSSKYGL